MYLAGVCQNPEAVKWLDETGVSDIPELWSTHEEADIRNVKHSLFADSFYRDENVTGRVIVRSPNTNVLLLLIHYYPQMTNTDELWFQTGVLSSARDGREYIPVQDMSKSLGPSISSLLPAVHTLTGYDTTSSLLGLGKKNYVYSSAKTFKTGSIFVRSLRK